MVFPAAGFWHGVPMPLPINIQELLNGRTVEWDRLEFKEGWNPEEAVHAICAFANDFHNWGGGYLVFGVGEQGGRPRLPPQGLEPGLVDSIQRKLLELGHRIQPPYHPICEPAEIQGRLVLIVWVPGGEMRPYKAPVSLGKENREWGYYIRLHSTTTRAKGELEQELLALANRIPFDDRQNGTAKVSDLQPTYIRSFLAEVGSDLQTEAGSLPLDQLGRRMQIVRGPEEAPRPLNVGLLFFSPDPAKWFPQTQIDIVHLPKGRGGDQIIEKTFRGPLGAMLRDALAYLRNQVVTEFIVKHADRAEAERSFNVPYAALEEALVNAIYHRSYEEREPVEVQITPDEITILSFPGPDRSIRMEDLKTGRAVARRYRNRRIGEFLKELELSEGRGTGIPRIIASMAENGSGEPEFITDDDRTSFLVRLPVLTRVAEVRNPMVDPIGGDDVTDSKSKGRIPTMGVSPMDSRKVSQSVRMSVSGRILLVCRLPQSAATLQAMLGLKDRAHFLRQYIQPLLDQGLLEATVPDKPTSSRQAYRLTALGDKWLVKHLERPRPLPPQMDI